MKETILIITTLLFSFDAYAGGVVQNAKVLNVRQDAGGKGIIKFDKTISSSPGCITSNFSQHLSFDNTTQGGRAIYTAALTALVNGNTMAATGKGHCDLYNGSYVEDANAIWIND